MSRFFRFLIVLLGLVFSVIPSDSYAHAPVETVCNPTVVNASSVNFDPTYYGQSFIIPGSGATTITSIGFGLRAHITTAIVPMTLTLTAADYNGLPTGPTLATVALSDIAWIWNAIDGSIICGQIDSAPEFVFNPPLVLQAGQRYAFYVQAPGAFDVEIQYSAGNPYDNGVFFVNTVSGWQHFGDGLEDAAFRVTTSWRPSLIVATQSWYSILQAHHFSKDTAVLATFLFACTVFFFFAIHTPKILKALGFLGIGGAFILTGLTTPFTAILIGCASIVGCWFTLAEKGTEHE